MDVDDPSPAQALSPSLRDASSNHQGSGSDDIAELGDDDITSPNEAKCSRSSFFVNADWRMGSTLANATTIVGQMYTERLDPPKRRHRYPIVLVHGDFHTGQVRLDLFRSKAPEELTR